MTTVRVGNLKGSLFHSPKNRGVSEDANTLEKQVMDIQRSFLQGVALRSHYWETLRVLFEASTGCGVDNWDGYSGCHVDRGSSSKALQFSKLLPVSVPLPDVSIDADGEVRYEWYRNPRQVFSVAIGRDGQLAYAGLFGTNKAYGVESLGDELPNAILDNIRRVYA